MADDLDIDALLEAPYEKKDDGGDRDRNGDRYDILYDKRSAPRGLQGRVSEAEVVVWGEVDPTQLILVL